MRGRFRRSSSSKNHPEKLRQRERGEEKRECEKWRQETGSRAGRQSGREGGSFSSVSVAVRKLKGNLSWKGLTWRCTCPGHSSALREAEEGTQAAGMTFLVCGSWLAQLALVYNLGPPVQGWKHHCGLGMPTYIIQENAAPPDVPPGQSDGDNSSVGVSPFR